MFITLVQVDPALLLACIVAAVAGAFVGAPIVQRSPVRLVQGVVGVALLIAALLFALKNLNLLPPGGEALTLPPTLFAIAVAAHFVMGVLMMFGIGLYAPSLIVLEPARPQSHRRFSDHDGLLRVPDADFERPLRAIRAH